MAAAGGHIELDEDPEQAALRRRRKKAAWRLSCSANVRPRRAGYTRAHRAAILDIHRINDTHQHIA